MQRIVGCFLEYDDRFVLLHRRDDKPDGNTWGLPAGKVEPGETDLHALQRELCEETGYQASQKEVEHLGDFPFTIGGHHLIFATFRIRLTDLPMIVVERSAHTSYEWVRAEEAAKKQLIPGLYDLLQRLNYIKT